jgi:hypothetical protein
MRSRGARRGKTGTEVMRPLAMVCEVAKAVHVETCRYHKFPELDADGYNPVPADHGPLEEYDERVHSRRLREDEHQRSKHTISLWD